MSLELVVQRTGGGVRLLSPDVGLFTCALPRGAAVAPGQRAGVLRRLGRDAPLVVPAGVAGVVASERPERVLAPVGSGQLLYEIAPLEGGAEVLATGEDPAATGLVLRAHGSGRFYHRPAPDEPPFVETGALVEEGTVVGMIEVMKTFAHVTYSAGGGLPARARVVRLVAGDGADVLEDEALVEVEPA